MDEAKFLEVAKKAAQAASDLIRTESGKEQSIIDKKSRFDIVTQVDFDAERKILEIIREAFPEHNTLSEEEGLTDKGSDYTWVIDPLDGTSLFTAGLPDYCVAIGLLKNNQPFLGVVSRVETNEVYWAQVSKGAYKNGQQIHVSNVDDLSRAVVFSDFQNTWEQRIADLKRAELLVKEVKTLRCGTATVSSLSHLAEGKISGCAHVARAWDFVAAAVLVTEAGGKITDWWGNPVDWSEEWIKAVLSNGLIHDQLVDIARQLTD